MRERLSRSRSPLRLIALSEQEQEAFLVEFAQHYWSPSEGSCERADRLTRYRGRLLAEIEQLVMDVCHDAPRITTATRVRWQRFVLLDDLARMSDVLFRGPIDPRHADEMDLRLHHAWRTLRHQIPGLADFAQSTRDVRISAAKMAMMLETGRPTDLLPDALELPDARTLSCLLSLRCEKDDAEELNEFYRLLCQKLQGCSCSHCHRGFDESSSCGIFDGEQLTIPVTVPKVLVPPCGHALHTLCIGEQIIPNDSAESRGLCRQCGQPYGWTGIDVDPMVNAFCLMFGPYVDTRSQEMYAEKKLSTTAILSISEVCVNFSLELSGLVSPSSIWLLLLRRHAFEHPDMVSLVGQEVLRSLTLPEGEELEVPTLVDSPAGPQSDGLDAPPMLMDEALPSLLPESLSPPSEPSDVSEELAEPSAVMLNQLVAGCDGDRSMNGLLPQTN